MPLGTTGVDIYNLILDYLADNDIITSDHLEQYQDADKSSLAHTKMNN